VSAHGRSSDDAQLKLYFHGKEVVHFPVTVYGNELLRVEAVFPAGELMLSGTTFPVFLVCSVAVCCLSYVFICLLFVAVICPLHQ